MENHISIKTYLSVISRLYLAVLIIVEQVRPLFLHFFQLGQLYSFLIFTLLLQKQFYNTFFDHVNRYLGHPSDQIRAKMSKYCPPTNDKKLKIGKYIFITRKVQQSYYLRDQTGVNYKKLLISAQDYLLKTVKVNIYVILHVKYINGIYL